MLLPSNVVRVHTGHFFSAAGWAAAATIVISSSVSKRHNPAVSGRTHRRISSATAPNTAKRPTPRAPPRRPPTQTALSGGEPAMLGVEVGIVQLLAEFNSKILSG